MPQSTRPKSGRTRGITPQGSIRISRRELLITLKGETASATLKPLNFPWLKNIAKAFDRVSWHGAKVFYRPSVGATTSGSVAIGVDWDSNTATLTYENVAAMTPFTDGAVWQPLTLVLPRNKLMSRKEYVITPNKDKDSDFDLSPGYLCVAADGAPSNTTLGHVWIEYDLTLFGTVAV